MLAWEFHVRMAYPVMPGKSVCAAECLLFRTKVASHLLLAGVVDGIFVTCEIVGSGEDSVARLVRAWVDSITTVRTGLTVQHC